MSVSWNPWHGCRKLSEGCRHCYVYRQDAQHDKDSREVRRTAAFNLPVRRTRDGRYKVPPGEMVYTCFTSDFLVEEADAWRAEAWEMIRIRSDLRFFFITKRIDRLMQVLPPDWGGGYENLAVGCTVENQAMADYRLPLLLDAPCATSWSSAPRCSGRSTSHDTSSPGSKRYPSGANRATKPAPAITTGCFRSAASASRQTFPSLSTKPARGLSRTDAFTASAARTSIRRPARPGSTTRQSDEVSPPYPPCTSPGIRLLFSHIPLPALFTRPFPRLLPGRYGSGMR